MHAHAHFCARDDEPRRYFHELLGSSGKRLGLQSIALKDNREASGFGAIGHCVATAGDGRIEPSFKNEWLERADAGQIGARNELSVRFGIGVRKLEVAKFADAERNHREDPCIYF